MNDAIAPETPAVDGGAPQATPLVQEKVGAEPAQPAAAKPVNWLKVLQGDDESQIARTIGDELKKILERHTEINDAYAVVVLFDADRRIDSFDANRIFNALSRHVPKAKDVLLLLYSGGGSVEPAYQISKLCKKYARERFIVAIPRRAKSAATLISLGADEIHMSPLGQLGPIDPQIGGLPALGVVQALQTIAGVAEKNPGSADMFARYLRQALTVEQIGYCERIGESAVQYAVRLLKTKPTLGAAAERIAKHLVYEYKDHGFVIDADEAKRVLGDSWIKEESGPLTFAEEIYRLFEQVDLLLQVVKQKRVYIGGALGDTLLLASA
jgi:hypothetical protein